MKAYAKILGVVLVALAIQITLAAGGKGLGDDLISRAITVTRNIDSIVSRAFTVTSNTDSIVSRAFTVTGNTDNIVSRAFTVTSNTDSLVSRAFTVSSNTDSIVSRAFTTVNCDPDDEDAGGLCADCDGDDIPDECELDCGADGGPCDVPSCGQSDDCNDNGVPDECELVDSDCNDNGVPDDCDITDGTSQDCNGNGIPDECEIDIESPAPGEFFCDPADPPPPLIECDPDCNDNGIPDDCEADCDGDGIPDECVIAGCEGEPACSDCNGNGVPDGCEPDCDGDMIPDECEIAACPADTPACDDCNGNGIPDECDLDDCAPDTPGCADCNDNGRPDECDIADCTPESPEFPDCADCNVNGVPDKCDIDTGFSQDVEPPPNGDRVPDECVVWAGGAEGDSWSTDGNWQGNDAPGNGNPDDLESVVIVVVGANVFLDIDVSIDSLLLGAAATLDVTQDGEFGDLTIADPGGAFDGNLLVEGELSIGDGRAIDAEGEVTIGPGGIYQAEDPNDPPLNATLEAGSITVQGGGVVNVSGLMALISEGEVTVGPGGVYQADPEAGGPITATLAAGSITVRGGTIDLTGSMELTTSGDLGLQSSDDGKGGCKGSGTPPDFNSADSAQVRVMGNFTISECAEVDITSSWPVIVDGNMQNESTLPADFNWDTGELQMNGPDDQTIEAAGQDRGPCPFGFNENFVIGTLTLAENTLVLVVDEFDNQEDGTTACDEALYVGVLILEAGSELQTNGCRVYYEELINDGFIPGFGTDVLQVESTCADIDGDGEVNAFDLALLLGSWGPCPADDDCPADQDGDGVVNAFDLAILLGSWGPVP